MIPTFTYIPIPICCPCDKCRTPQAPEAPLSAQEPPSEPLTHPGPHDEPGAPQEPRDAASADEVDYGVEVDVPEGTRAKCDGKRVAKCDGKRVR